MTKLETELLEVEKKKLFWKMAKAYWKSDQPLLDKTKNEYIKVSDDLKERYLL